MLKNILTYLPSFKVQMVTYIHAFGISANFSRYYAPGWEHGGSFLSVPCMTLSRERKGVAN